MRSDTAASEVVFSFPLYAPANSHTNTEHGKAMRISITLVGLLPASRFKNLLLRRLGWAVDPSAVIQPNLFIGVGKARLDARAHIWPFNVIPCVSLPDLRSGAQLGSFNWVTGGSPWARNESSRLTLGKEAAITSRHYIDVSGSVVVGGVFDCCGRKVRNSDPSD